MAILGIEHIAVVCKDTVSLAKWYAKTLGFVEVYNNKKTPPTLLLKAQNGIMIEFVPGEGRPRPMCEEKDEGWRHLAIAVNNMDQVMADLTKKKVEWIGDVKVGSGGTARARFFKDPEANLIHIIERTGTL